MLNCQQFNLNSGNALDSTSTSSSFSVTIKIPPHETFTHVCLLSCSIPKSYYLIQDGYNTFTLSENNVNTVVTIPAGNYSWQVFRTQIALILTAASSQGWTYTCTAPPATAAQTGKATYTVAGNGGLQPSFVFTNAVYEQFGFVPNSTNTFAANTITSANVVKFQVEDALFIHSDIVGDPNSDVLQSIFVSATPDFTSIVYQCYQYETAVKKISVAKSNVFRFTLTNEDGQLIDLNGQWQMCIMVGNMATMGAPAEAKAS